MGRHDSTDCPDTRTNQRNTSPARRAGVLTAAMSLALLAAAGAAVAAPHSSPAVPLAQGFGAAIPEAAAFSATEVALSDRKAAARIARTSRSATRGPVPTEATPETTVGVLAPAEPVDEQPAEPEVVGFRYVEVPLKVRKTPETDADVVTVLDPADKVNITDVTDGDYRQIVYKGEPRWVTAEYLSKSKPKASESGGLSGAACASGSGVEGGLGANAIAAHRAICARFPAVSGYGGYRGGSANHSSGRALDVMVSGSAGQAVAKWARANASALGITEVIHAQRIWTTQRAGDGWRAMSDRGSATANHYDHVHLSFR